MGADLAAVDQLALVKFAAFISVNLAVVNALPFPGLDGGQVSCCCCSCCIRRRGKI